MAPLSHLAGSLTRLELTQCLLSSTLSELVRLLVRLQPASLACAAAFSAQEGRRRPQTRALRCLAAPGCATCAGRAYGALHISASVSMLTALENLSRSGCPITFAEGSSLPPSITRLDLADSGHDVPPQASWFGTRAPFGAV